MRKYLYIVLGFACALWYLTKSTEQADAFFPRGGAGIVGAASVAISSVQAVGGGGGSGGTGLTIAWNGGKTFTGSGTSLTTANFAYKPSTGNLIALGIVGGSTYTNCTDIRGNVYTQDNYEDRLGAATAVYHFVATATYNGTYTVTCGIANTSSIMIGILVSSNSHSSVSVDVTTKSFQPATPQLRIYTGTTTVTSQTAGLLFSAANIGSGTNDAMAPINPLTQIAEEENGTSFQEGLIAYSTTSVAGVTVKEQWSNSNTADGASVATVVFKTTP